MKLKDLSFEEIKGLKYACAKFIIEYVDNSGNNFRDYGDYLNTKVEKIFRNKFNVPNNKIFEKFSELANFVAERDNIPYDEVDSYLGSLFDSTLNKEFVYENNYKNAVFSFDNSEFLDDAIIFKVTDRKVCKKLIGANVDLYIFVFDKSEYDKVKDKIKFVGNKITCEFSFKDSKREFIMFID